jgi:hypothetical protein
MIKLERSLDPTCWARLSFGERAVQFRPV